MFFFNNKETELKVLGVSGKAGSGKDYLAQSVAYRYNFLPLALASHFKVGIAAKSPQYPIEEVFGSVDRSPEVRSLLQQAGTEGGRDVFGENIWCLHAEAWMYHFSQYGFTRFVVTDVRFPNEVEWINKLGGKVIRVEGRGGLTDSGGTHVSETALDGLNKNMFDAVFDNSVELERTSVERFTNIMRELCDVA